MAKKKSNSRGPASFTIDVDKLKTLFARYGLNPNQIAKRVREQQALPNNESAYRRALEKRQATAEIIAALSLVLDVSPSFFVTDPSYTPETARKIDELKGQSRRSRVLEKETVLPGGARRLQTQDVKNVIHSQEISKALLNGGPIPSLFDAVVGSKMLMPQTDEEKDDVPRDGEVHHFLSLSVLPLIRPKGRRKTYAVAAHRNRDLFASDHQHTFGMSCLISASFFFNIKTRVDECMDEWVYRVANGTPEAEDAFHKGADCVLLRLLSHKLRDLSPSQPKLEPFGVVTRDERPEPGRAHRVYTMYVFRMELRPKYELTSLDGYALEVLRPPQDGSLVELRTESEARWTRDGAKKNLMDVVAWRALLSDAPEVQEGMTRFTRGFRVA